MRSQNIIGAFYFYRHDYLLSAVYILQNFSALNSEAVEQVLKSYQKNIGIIPEQFSDETLDEYTFFKQSSHRILMQEVILFLLG